MVIAKTSYSLFCIHHAANQECTVLDHIHKHALLYHKHSVTANNRLQCSISTDNKKDPDIIISTKGNSQLLHTLYLMEDGGSMGSTIQCKYLVDLRVLIGAGNVQSCLAILYRS